MLVEITKDGMLIHARVKNARSPAIERGKRTAAITGIVVHQTDANTAQSSLNSYKNPKANAAHFLIDKDGTIYQTAAIYQRTNHVGPLKARCLLVGKCRAKDYEGAGVKGMHRIEMMKAPGDRYPSNMEAIGVGSRTIGCLKTSVRCCMAERYCKQFWQHGNPVPRSCHADQPSQERYDHTCHPFGIAASQWY
ncbi:N-acetylmuramoyl-L-alanine amidase [Delftia tsuruhatensis]|uniref:N-acetylmuramoyl-L-alanine amidase n=1 Tax=Delftia tsuruhatensis TaxID=180282 RepID=UPI002AD3529D|nr:N-acetylmuramoyl-L-alanine amidase [Delftia tsuruhatensis]WQM81290.1 N-acetylmuramoyl-L-alanine amidase [Delftia tsuruhatensis]